MGRWGGARQAGRQRHWAQKELPSVITAYYDWVHFISDSIYTQQYKKQFSYFAKLESYSNVKHFFIALLHAHFCF